jgi:hypothetical protein
LWLLVFGPAVCIRTTGEGKAIKSSASRKKIDAP